MGSGASTDFILFLINYFFFQKIYHREPEKKSELIREKSINRSEKI